MKELKLTPEELALIEAKRQAEAEKIESEKKAAIEKMTKEFNHARQIYIQRHKATIDFYQKGFETHPDYRLEEKDIEIKSEAKVGDKVVETLRETMKKAAIVYKDDNVRIFVKPWVTYGDSVWSRGVNKGYHMYIHGIGYNQETKPLKNPKTVIKKIKDHFQDKIDKAEMAKAKESAVKNFALKQKKAFPEAEVTTYKEWVRDHFGRNQGHQEDRVRVVFPNGVRVQYRVWSDSSYSRVSLEFPVVKDDLKFVSQLSNLKF